MSNNHGSMPARLSIDHVRGQIANRGYELVSDSYLGRKSKLEIRCPAGHVFYLRYDGFVAGQGCKFCSWPKRHLARRLTPSELNKLATDRGGKFLSSDEYKNTHELVSWECMLGHFFKMTTNNVRLGHWCPTCANKVRGEKSIQRWRDMHPSKAEFSRIERNRDKELLKKYGIDLAQYNEMLSRQNGKCAICKRGPYGDWEVLAVDHDHTSGDVRGLLCHRCNLAIGQFDDIPELLRSAADYLDQFASGKAGLRCAG